MPNKYSHGLVLSQHQYRGILDTQPPLSLKPPSSSQSESRSRTRSPALSVFSLSDYSDSGSASSDYLRLEPDIGPESSYRYGSAKRASRQSVDTAFLDTRLSQPTSGERSRPLSTRLRLESPFGNQIEDSPSRPPKLEPALSERPYYEIPPAPRPNLESTPQERLRIRDSPPPPTNPRPPLHHKSSSTETQIYAPETTNSPPPTREDQDLFSEEADEPNSLRGHTINRQYHSPAPTLHERPNYPSRPSLDTRHLTSPTSTQERQHVFSMDSPGSSPPPISRGDRKERFSSETQRAYLSSPTRNRRQSFLQETQALASSPSVQSPSAESPFGTQNSPLFPSSRDLQDFFSAETQGSYSTPAATIDRRDFATMTVPSALSTRSQNDQVRPSSNMQRLQSPRQSQDNQRRPSVARQHSSFERRPQTLQESFYGSRQSMDSQGRRDRQDDPRLGLSSNQSFKETSRSRGQSFNSKTTHDRQARPSPSAQQLSLEQFIQESEKIQEPTVESQTSSSQRAPSYKGNSNSSQNTLASAQRYTPKDTSLEHGPQSRRDRPSKVPDTFASQHKILLPTSQGGYDNVLIETHGFPPERPPSPPATPDSGKSFSPTRQAKGSQKSRPPPPIPQRSVRRSPPRQRSMLRSTNSSMDKLPSEPPKPRTSSSIDKLLPDPPRPKTSSSNHAPTNPSKPTAVHSPTFSISTRRSSINAFTSSPSAPFSGFSETMPSPPRKSFSPSRDEDFFDDEDLGPLPSPIDFNVLPYENPNAGPAIFRATQLGLERQLPHRYEDPNAEPAFFRATSLGRSVSHSRTASSRASSFDSAAPPPIGLNRRITHATAEPHQPKVPKKESKMSLLSFLRSASAPKAVLYSEATQGQPPVSLSASKTRYNALRSRADARMRPGLDPRTSAARSPAHVDAAEKRKSWLKGDEVELNRAASRLEKKREFERILNNI